MENLKYVCFMTHFALTKGLMKKQQGPTVHQKQTVSINRHFLKCRKLQLSKYFFNEFKQN